MASTKFRVIALLGRRPGLRVLRETLTGRADLEVAAVFTHGRLPGAEGGGERPELSDYRTACRDGGIPLIIADGAAARHPELLLPDGQFDLLLALSWRYIVPPEMLLRFSKGGVNLHRGALPRHAGALPVQRAVEAGDRRVAITAHDMTDQIDAGSPVAVVWYEIEPLPQGRSSADYAEEIKRQLEPLYAPLAELALRVKLHAPMIR